MRDFYISEDKYADSMRDTVMPYLADRRTEFYIEGYDGNKLHVMFYSADNPKKTVVISHGYTESSEKFHEMTYYFLLDGFNVYIPDQRGHGLSYRKLSDNTLTYIDDFDEYEKDFELHAAKAKELGNLPLLLYAHSMGGAVAMQTLIKCPELFEAAFLSSPMIVPASGNIPMWVGKAIAGAAVLLGMKEKRAFISPPYSGHEEFENSCKTCKVRFDEYEKIKSSTPCYQNACTTYGWICQSLKVGPEILKKGVPEKVNVRIFMAIAGKDTVVLAGPQKELAGRLPNCTLKIYPESKHEIYGCTDDVLFGYYDDLLGFYEGIS